MYFQIFFFISPTLSANEPLGICYLKNINEVIVDKFTAITNCTNVTITQIQINGPIGLIYSNMIQQSTNTWYINTTWQPTTVSDKVVMVYFSKGYFSKDILVMGYFSNGVF